MREPLESPSMALNHGGSTVTTTYRTASNIYPSLFYDDAPAAIEWLCRAFGFEARLVVKAPDGSVMHSELSYGPGVIMVGSSKETQGQASPRRMAVVNQSLCIRVDDPDAHFARAKAAGAAVIREIRDEDYGSRGYMVSDPEGHQWYFGSYDPGEHWES
jgi:uncharacterized glyoxalase superfamily protein PhnB